MRRGTTRLAAVLCLLLIAASRSTARSPFWMAQERWSLGAYGGPALSYAGEFVDDIHGVYAPDKRSYGRQGGSVFAQFGYYPLKFIGAQAGVGFMARGESTELDNASATILQDGVPVTVDASLSDNVKFNFIEIPLVVKPMLPLSRLRLYGVAGLSIGFCVSAKQSLDIRTTSSGAGGTSTDTEEIDEIDLKQDHQFVDSTGETRHYSYGDYFRTVYPSAVLGFGFEIRIGDNSGISFDLRKYKGLQDFRTYEGDDIVWELTAFTANLGYRYYFGMPQLQRDPDGTALR